MRFAFAACAAYSLTNAANVSTRRSILSRTFGLHSNEQPVSPAAATTLASLDVNQDGHVSSNEVTAYAMSQGMGAALASQEFTALDTNRDGALDTAELAGALGAAPPVADVQPPAAQDADHRVTRHTTMGGLGAHKRVAESQLEPQAELEPSLQPAQPLLSTMPVLRASQVRSLKGAGVALPSAARSVAELDDGTGQSAARVASRVVEHLALEARRERQAQALDRRAAELRANSTELTRLTLQRAGKAGSIAAHHKAIQLLDMMTQLESQAEHDEVEAADLRAKSRAGLLQADELMAVADSALNQ
mmetsp:Transcript_74170/g.172021  ORF Transcript_74170/g.172021 Transcript_74170/m.172021 type:complete len:305 (+) Transcript_74170:89-1003(+)